MIIDTTNVIILKYYYFLCIILSPFDFSAILLRILPLIAALTIVIKGILLTFNTRGYTFHHLKCASMQYLDSSVF